MAKSREDIAEDIARKLYGASIIGFDQIDPVRDIVLNMLPTRKATKKAKP